jgi:hypothetical protein
MGAPLLRVEIRAMRGAFCTESGYLPVKNAKKADWHWQTALFII